MAALAIRDDGGWDNPTAFGDLPPEPLPNNQTGGIFKPVSSSITHGKGFCSFHLFLVDTETGEQAEQYFNNVIKGKNGCYSVKRNSKFVKLYRNVFGDINPRRFSKAHQLLKHFHDKDCLLKCKISEHKRKNGQLYNIVTESVSHSITGNLLETDWKLTGNLLETNWKPQTLETPINTWSRGQSEVITNKLITNEVIANRQIPTPLMLDASELYQVRNKMGGFDFRQMPNESIDDYYERVIDATLTILESIKDMQSNENCLTK